MYMPRVSLHGFNSQSIMLLIFVGPEPKVLRPWPYICWGLNKSHSLLIIGNMHTRRHLFREVSFPYLLESATPAEFKRNGALFDAIWSNYGLNHIFFKEVNFIIKYWNCPDWQLDWVQICCIHFICTQKEEVWGLTEENKDCRVKEMNRWNM